jgi:hypothetical protein
MSLGPRVFQGGVVSSLTGGNTDEANGKWIDLAERPD